MTRIWRGVVGLGMDSRLLLMTGEKGKNDSRVGRAGVWQGRVMESLGTARVDAMQVEFKALGMSATAQVESTSLAARTPDR